MSSEGQIHLPPIIPDPNKPNNFHTRFPNGKISGVRKDDKSYFIGDIYSYEDALGYENFVEIKTILYDEKKKNYLFYLEGNGFTDFVFINSLKEKKINHLSTRDKKKDLSYPFNKGERICFKVNGKEVVAEIIDIEIVKNKNGDVDTNLSIIIFKCSDDKTYRIKWRSVKKVHKDTPLSTSIATGQKKYTLEDDNKYRFKYAKYKAKYLMYKNNLHN